MMRFVFWNYQAVTVRQHLAEIYEREQLWTEAAHVLIGIPLETGQRYQPTLYLKYQIFIKKSVLKPIWSRLQDENLPTHCSAVFGRR